MPRSPLGPPGTPRWSDVTYAGFGLLNGELVYTSRRTAWPWHRSVRLVSEGLDLYRGLQCRQTLAWQRYGRTSAIGVGEWRIGLPFNQHLDILNERSLRLSSPPLTHWLEVLAAVIEYVGLNPAARPGLDDPSRCERLIVALQSGGLDRANNAHEHMAGDRYYLDQAVDAVLSIYAPTILGRIVAGCQLPTEEELVGQVRARLRSDVDGKWRDPEQIRTYLRRRTTSTPWPFDVLLGG